MAFCVSFLKSKDNSMNAVLVGIKTRFWNAIFVMAWLLLLVTRPNNGSATGTPARQACGYEV